MLVWASYKTVVFPRRTQAGPALHGVALSG